MENQEDGFLDRLGNWFSGWKFPTLALLLMFFFSLMMVFFLFYPVSESAMGRFARDFKVWCFGYKPESGQMEWIYIIMLIMDPLLISIIISVLWKHQIVDVLKLEPKKVIPYTVFAFLLVFTGGIGFTVLANVSDSSNSQLEFPGERIRTGIPSQDFTLVDYKKKNVSLSDFRGKVVVITSFYTSCGKTCPKILMQLMKIMSGLSEAEKNDLSVITITMDPKNDDSTRMEKAAISHKMDKEPYHFLNGEPEKVLKTLDHYEFARTVDEKTGDIDHVNLFVVIDKQGKIAYRFSLGDLQEKWLLESLKQLTKEKG